MAVGRALESASMSWLINHLASQQVIDFLLKWKIDSALIGKLKTLLISITAFLNGVEDRQVNDPLVKAWLDELRDAAYEAEDLIDEIATRALKSKLRPSKLTRSLPLRESVKEAVDYKVKDVSDHMNPYKKDIESKIQGVINRLKWISERKDTLGLTKDKSTAELKSAGSAWGSPRLTTPAVTKSRVHGRDADMEFIKSLLISGGDKLSVIPIVGMGGIGKTTLAQIVYNDVDVMRCFKLRAWAFVSDVFDSARILRTLIESATGNPCKDNSLELLQRRLRGQLKERKFLTVLDDVWNENYLMWDGLRTTFENVGAGGSRIIVTTRNEAVAGIVRTVPTHHLNGLLEDASWSLFEQIAFPEMESDNYPNLRPIGREIVQKCKGLPLALKTLGGSLLQDMSEAHWRHILESRLWDNSDGILPALWLSYYHLPPHIKKCFAYCSMFPKGFEFNREILVLLWVAEGLIQLPREKHDRLEDEADTFFTHLLSRSFFQQYGDDNLSFIMHDLIHELAQCVSRKASLSLANKMENLRNYDSLEKSRHLSYIRGHNDAFSKFEPLGKAKNLRTFLPLNPMLGHHLSSLSEKVIHELLPNLRVLRVLSLQSYQITSIPDSIGKLKHLRYLNLSQSLIEELPSSVNDLYNLQTLILDSCMKLKELPDDFGSLINLRHLNLNKTKLQQMPSGMGKLVNLRSLTDFVVGNGHGSGIGELKDLSMLRGRLYVSGLHNVKRVEDAMMAKMKAKKDLDELILEWGHEFDGSRNEGVEVDVLDALEPNEMLERLTIKYYGSPEFPSWLGDPSFDKMVNVHLHGCQKCTRLPPLGMLPKLESLVIQGMDSITSVRGEFYRETTTNTGESEKPFPSLVSLKFEDMKNWEEWVDEDVMGFPKLRELHVLRCPKLSTYRVGFASLEVLRIIKCAALTSFSECSAVETSQFAEYPHLRKLVIINCNELNSLPAPTPSLEVLHIDGCEKLTNIPRLGMLKHLYLSDSSSEVLRNLVGHATLTTLEVRGISQLMNFPEEFLRESQKLEELKVYNCNGLIGLSNDEMGLNCLSSLKKLIISDCAHLEHLNFPPAITSLDLKHCSEIKKLPPELKDLPLTELKVERCTCLEAFPVLPPMLKRLVVRDCSALKKLSGEILDKNNALEYLEVHRCSSLDSILENGTLPTALRHIKVADCKNLKQLPQGILSRNGLALEYLEIDACPCLVSFPVGELPGTLEKLEISDCEALGSLPDNLISLGNLDILSLIRCNSLVHCPRGGFPTNLRSLQIEECEKLEDLPKGFHTLRCLQELKISFCPNLEPSRWQGFPTRLISLSIEECQKLKSIDQWKLHKLTNLETLSVGGCKGLCSFPSEYLLPDKLTSLHILRLPDLESLGRGLNNLTSLESLLIRGCDKLSSLPENGLPSSLGVLTIRQCPRLKEKCENDRGAEWSKIKDIPSVVLN